MPTNDSTLPFDIDKAIREIISRIGAAEQHPLARPEERTAAKTVALLALIVGEQNRRLRVLEPCPQSGGEPHVWAPIGKRFADPGEPLRCLRCDLRKVSA